MYYLGFIYSMGFGVVVGGCLFWVVLDREGEIWVELRVKNFLGFRVWVEVY